MNTKQHIKRRAKRAKRREARRENNNGPLPPSSLNYTIESGVPLTVSIEDTKARLIADILRAYEAAGYERQYGKPLWEFTNEQLQTHLRNIEEGRLSWLIKS